MNKWLLMGMLILGTSSPAFAFDRDGELGILEAAVGETAICSHWECTCKCVWNDQELENPETGTFIWYPGGSKSECSGHNGSTCLGGGGELRGKLSDCEWTLVPDTDC